MAFPQTTALEASRNGQEVWRLFTPLESSGDIYESELSCRAAVIGPDSDIARANITYYDVQNANQANTASISVNKPYIGRLDALASRTFQTGDQARLLISPLDLVPPPGYRPPSAGATDPIETVVPNIDLLFYLGEVPGYIGPRSNRVYLFEQLPSFSSLNPQWFLIPFYGRRFAEVTLKSMGFIAQPSVIVRIYGLNFSNILPSAALADNGHQQELLTTRTFLVPALGAGITDSIVISDRAFDYLGIEIDGAAGFPDATSFLTHIVTSDEI